MAFALNAILDSGAFTAWTRGESVDLDEYVAFIKSVPELSYYFSLDYIPGVRGVRPTRAEVEYASKQSLYNYKYMLEQGLTPIPVVHFGCEYSLADKYYLIAKVKPAFIGVGGLVGVPCKLAQHWLDGLFANCDYPFHGFGISSSRLLTRYPWASVDSSVWAQAPQFGAAFCPKLSASGLPDYQHVPRRIIVTTWDRKHGALPANHLDHMGPSVRAAVDAYFTNHLGIDLEACREDYELRAQACAACFYQFSQSYVYKPRCFSKGLFK